MGLFDDTIRDARRPLWGGWVRREAADDEPVLEAGDDEPPEQSNGMQTIFRYQKAESRSGLREASLRSGMESNHLPVDDPSSAGTKDGSPRPPAWLSAGDSSYSARADGRVGNLATGQAEHIGSSKRAVTDADFESLPARSAVSSVSVESGSLRERQSVIQNDSATSESRNGATYVEQQTGRGAPSDTPSAAEGAAPSAATSMAVRGRAAAGRKAAGADRVTEHTVPAAPRTGRTEAVADGAAAPSSLPQHRVAARVIPAMQGDGGRPVRVETAAGAADAAPNLVIGRIDVTVLAHEPPAPRQSSPAPERGFLSRNYLKRL